jgi:threonine dehydrogenase-like Zn-dependent dehydrogenase
MYTQYATVPERALHPVSDDISLRNASVVKSTSVTAQAVIESSRVGASDRVLVASHRPIGQLTTQVVREQGVEVVVSECEITQYKREISVERKIRTINETVGEYMKLAVAYVDFDCDPNIPNYQHPPESFCRFSAHIALEDRYAAKGSKLLD